jgi:hypothetical protein
MPVDHRLPDGTGIVVARIIGLEDFSSYYTPQLIELPIRQRVHDAPRRWLVRRLAS